MSDYDPHDIEAQTRTRLNAEELNRHQRSQELEDLKWVMSDARGRRFMWRLLGFARVHHPSFAGEQTHETAFREGMRNVGTKLFADVHEACPQQYLVMTKEAKKDARRTDRQHATG